MPTSLNRSGESCDLFGSVLASVSRSFYLTIRVLPRAVRRPVALAYLLARTSDTVADNAEIPVHERLEALREFGRALAEGQLHLRGGRFSLLRDRVADPSERILLGHADDLLALYQALEPGDREEVFRVLEVIVRGQELDLERFKSPPGGGVVALANAGELEDYTYRVAGCVGEFWTRVCFRHLSRYARLDESEMIRLGIGFGKGLQLINILRDAPADLTAGRCYLPEDELASEGVQPGDILAEPGKARKVVARWQARAQEHLEEGRRYLEAVQPWRVRLACFLPWAIGLKTIALMKHHPPLDRAERVKITRKQVRALLLQGLLVACSNLFLRRFAKER